LADEHASCDHNRTCEQLLHRSSLPCDLRTRSSCGRILRPNGLAHAGHV